MRNILILSFLALFVHTFATGLTVDAPDLQNARPGPQAPLWHPSQTNGPEHPHSSPPINREEWYVEQSWEFDMLLGPGGNYGLSWEAGEPDHFQSATELTAAAAQAVQKAPRWLRADLSNVFSLLDEDDQDLWAAIINEADNPLIDEIAFCVAHTSTEYLSSTYAFPELFVQNAQLLYEIDAELEYVEITDTGAWPDNDYWSTTTYQRLNESGTVETVEVPRDIYYWYLVDPKITDEIPAFIDPSLIESNATHASNISPDGVFWRDWFWTTADSDYPLLSDMLDGVTSLWARDGSDGTAIQAVQQWVNQSMSFTSNSERPHQPVRIYRKHIGRCGEYADITSAAARTALIPCTGILSISTDHTWNEFWESGWVSWEPVNGYVNNPLVYENGWGKVFGTVFEIRSDGYLTPVTDRYSEASGRIAVHVEDTEERPIDGARIILAIMDNGTLRSDMVGFTDRNGVCEFIVGDARDYYMRVTTPLGNYPAQDDEYALLVESMPDAGNYDFSAPIDAMMTWPDYTAIDAPPDGVDDYRLAVTFESVGQVVSGVVTWDDIDVTGTRPLFYKHAGDGGSVNWFGGSADDFIFCDMGWPFNAFHAQWQSTSGTDVFDVPTGSNWYVWLDNGCSAASPQHVTGTLEIWHWGNNDAEHTPEIANTGLESYPNPFNPETSFRFSLSQAGHVRLEVFNILGQRVAMPVDQRLEAGTHEIGWNADHLASGVYLARLVTSDRRETARLVLLK